MAEKDYIDTTSLTAPLSGVWTNPPTMSNGFVNLLCRADCRNITKGCNKKTVGGGLMKQMEQGGECIYC